MSFPLIDILPQLRQRGAKFDRTPQTPTVQAYTAAKAAVVANLTFIAPAARFLLRHRASGAIFLMALRTSKAPHHIVQPRIPSRECRKCARAAAADVAAGTLEENQVLTEPVGQLFDFQIAHTLYCI